MRLGYKSTQAGAIPEDWDVKPLHQISTVVRGGSPRPAGDLRYFNGSYIPWLTVAALTNIPASQLVVSETATGLTQEGSLHSRTLTAGTPIIANSGATLGVAKILGIKCCANDGIAALLDVSEHVSPHYLVHYINTKTSYLRDTVATGNGQPNLNTGLIGNIRVPLPPTRAEQEAIAAALSDADSLIESLEQLLAKNQDIKQGAMQELLTGKKRLPGFSEEWGIKQLGSVLKFQVGFPFSSSFFNEDGQGLRLVKNHDLKSDDQMFYYSGKYEPAYLVRNGDVLVGMDGEFLPCLWAKGLALLNQRVGRVVPLNGLNRVFAFYHLIEPLHEIESTTSGTTVKHLSHGDVEGIERPLPSVEEQTAIAEVLTDMDAKIAVLHEELRKASNLKQGMMQELLTGRIRLV